MRMTTRLIAGTCSAVLLSGCSWFGYGGGSANQAYQTNNSVRYKNSAKQYNMGSGQRTLGRCQITSPTQPIPSGCRPEDVTLAFGGAQNYSQQGQYTSGGYGTHVGAAKSAQAGYTPEQRFKRPILRGQFGLEIDYSISGELYDPGVSAAVASYDRSAFAEGVTEGSIAAGSVTTTTYTSSDLRLGRIIAPRISLGDVYTAPLRASAGLEMILNDHLTLYADAGYTRAEGKKGGGVTINEELLRTVSTQDYITDPANGVVGDPLGAPVEQTTFIPNEDVAQFIYDFNELEKYDFSVGGRYYFNPILKNKLQRPLTPFVSASAGAAHYNETTVTENQRQRYLQRAFGNNQTNPNGDFYDVSFGVPVQIYDAQWVPYGAVKAGLEWQMTAKTALAFEAGIKYETARDFSDGTQGDDNISVPITIRGSYNF